MTGQQTVVFQSVTPRLARIRRENDTIAALQQKLRELARTLIRKLLCAHFPIVLKSSNPRQKNKKEKQNRLRGKPNCEHSAPAGSCARKAYWQKRQETLSQG